MQRWVSQADAERVLRPVLCEAGVKDGSFGFQRRWLRIVRPNGQLLTISFHCELGETEEEALDRMSRDLGRELGIIAEPAYLDL